MIQHFFLVGDDVAEELDLKILNRSLDDAN